MKILAIETSCDETAIALVEATGGIRAPKFRVLKNLVASQIAIHRPFGGVVPNLAKREHLVNLPVLYKKIEVGLNSKFKNQKSKIQSKSKKLLNPQFSILNPIDLIAVTVGPGLEPALWTGIEFAKQLHKRLTANVKHPTVQLVGANHLEGHLYSFLLPEQKKAEISNIPPSPKSLGRAGKYQKSKIFPAIALIVSGGHTTLLLLKDLKTRKKLGETRDDAVGEAFDKVARILGLPYPGGPEVEKLAKRGNPDAINFPRPMIHQKNYDFSFSGLKTAVLYHLRDNPRANKADIAASFQKAAIDVLVAKTLHAVKEYNAKSILLSGGVAANKALRTRLKQETLRLRSGQGKSGVHPHTKPGSAFSPHGKNPRSGVGVKLFVADPIYNTDNAAMIAVAAYINLVGKSRHPKGVGIPTGASGKYRLTARGDLNI